MLELDVTLKHASGGRMLGEQEVSGGGKEWKNTSKDQYALRKRRWERY